MKGEINLLAIDRDDLREIVREMTQPEEYLDFPKIQARFSFSETFVRTLVREGKIKAYPVSGHSKVVRYSASELRAVFLNMQNT